MTKPMPKKLIEVALPLPEINDASAYDKMPGIGPHPKGIHHWWARLPLPTARAVLFASVVDDPESHPENWPTEEAQNAERERLFGILRRMMGKRLHDAPEVYAEAQAEMLLYCNGRLPSVLDPFAGGGSIPLEANRLGFAALAGDLNPVAVLLNKCNLEIAPRWADCAPVNPVARSRLGGGEAWRGTHGLSNDVRYYGDLVRRRAIEKIGYLYPTVRLSGAVGDHEAAVVAWIWTRTVASPNPAARKAHVPVMSSFMLSTKKGKEVWVEPVFDDDAPDGWRFEVRTGTTDKDKVDKARLGTRAGKAQDFNCILTNTPIERSYVQDEGKAGRLRERMVAIVMVGRGYASPTPEHEAVLATVKHDPAIAAARATFLSGAIPDREGITGGVCSAYGLKTWGHLFSDRQLVALLVLSDLVKEVQDDVRRDALERGFKKPAANLYAAAVVIFLALNLDRCADLNNSLCTWNSSDQVLRNLFKRQALPMVWDFAEANILADVVGGWSTCIDRTAKCLLTMSGGRLCEAVQMDAASASYNAEGSVLVSTDPPYYNNISYATLSDFFYVWLRRSLGDIFPDLFSTVLVPKLPELTASPDRFEGDRHKAKAHFETGFRHAFGILRDRIDPQYPLTIYYAFKQDDEGGDGDGEEGLSGLDLTTGWETLLEALLSSGFQITATWPVRASQKWRMVSVGTNALASYIILACRVRPSDAPQIASTQFRQELRRTLPAALRHLQQGNIAPVDFAQAALGPGMAVYSRYSRILESSGKALGVRAAIGIINQTLSEVLSELEDDFDAETRWAIAWFEHSGFDAGDFGDAELLSKAKATTVAALQQAGIVLSRSSKVRLLRPEELAAKWEPSAQRRVTVWEMTHHLLRLYHYEKAGDEATGGLLRKLGSEADLARELAYRLFKSAEKKKLSQEAQGYNALVLGWPEVARLARELPLATTDAQALLI